MFNLHHKVSERRIKEQDVIFFTRVDDEMVLFILNKNNQRNKQ